MLSSKPYGSGGYVSGPAEHSRDHCVNVTCSRSKPEDEPEGAFVTSLIFARCLRHRDSLAQLP